MYKIHNLQEKIVIVCRHHGMQMMVEMEIIFSLSQKYLKIALKLVLPMSKLRNFSRNMIFHSMINSELLKLQIIYWKMQIILILKIYCNLFIILKIFIHILIAWEIWQKTTCLVVHKKIWSFPSIYTDMKNKDWKAFLMEKKILFTDLKLM